MEIHHLTLNANDTSAFVDNYELELGEAGNRDYVMSCGVDISEARIPRGSISGGLKSNIPIDSNNVLVIWWSRKKSAIRRMCSYLMMTTNLLR